MNFALKMMKMVFKWRGVLEQSTLLVWTLFVLNVVEVYLLVVMAADAVGGDFAACVLF